MKKRRLLYLGLNGAGVIIAFGVIGALYFYVREDMTKFFVGLAIATIGLILFVALYCSYNFADYELKQRWMSYVLLKKDNEIDFQKELTQTKNKFDQDNDPQKNLIPKPNVRGVNHLRDFDVLKTGDITYGCLVEANLKLFSPSKFVHQVLPAVIVYSFNGDFQNNPLKLTEVAQEFFRQHKDNVLKDETKMFANYKISDEITGSREVFATVVLVYRKHLPWGGFPGSNLIFPVIANPNQNTSAFIVDSKYWSDNLIAKFLQNVTPTIKPIKDEPISSDKVEEIFGVLNSENHTEN